MSCEHCDHCIRLAAGEAVDEWTRIGRKVTLMYRLLRNGRVEEYTGCGSYPWVAAPEDEGSRRLLDLVLGMRGELA